MGRYVLRRILTSVVVLFGVSLVAFMLPRLTAGDPALILMGDNATPEMIEQTREFWGLNKPLPAQYVTFLANALTGDMGKSLVTGRTTASMISGAFPNTLFLALLAWLWAVCLGIPLGMIAALRRNGIIDLVIRVCSMIGRGVPNFWLGIMMIMLFAVRLRLLPSSGLGEGAARIRHLILPAFVLGTGVLSLIIRMVRSEVLEVMGQDYMRTAVAKGLRRKVVLCRHALKNAFIPVVTVMGLEIGALMGGAIVTETVFAYPGLGRLAVESVYGYDYPMIQALVLVFAASYVFMNFLVDIVYAGLDPRIRYA